MKRIEVLFGVLKVPLDALSVFIALLIAYRLRELNIDLLPGIQLLQAPTTLPPLSFYLQGFALFGTLLFLALSASLKLYLIKITLGFWREMQRVIVVTVIWVAIIVAWYFLVEKQLFFSRILLVHAAFFTALLVMTLRSILTLVQRSLLARGIGVRFVASLGYAALPAPVHTMLQKDMRFRYAGHSTTLEEFRRNTQGKHVDMIFHTDAHPTNQETNTIIEYCRSHHIAYNFLPPVLIETPHLLRVARFGLMPVLAFEPTPLDGWGRVWKRLFDVLGSIALIIILSPLLLLISLMILFTCGLPILYVSMRIGQYGRERIHMLKFRTMIRNADAKKEELIAQSHRTDGPLFKMKRDPRVTPMGAFLRRWTLDELPQLFNVLIGEMSLVGPRPHLPDEVDRYKDYHRRVFTVRPGMTGLAQISGRSNLMFDEEVRLDLQYIEEWSLLLDVWIMWRTIFVVLKRDGAD